MVATGGVAHPVWPATGRPGHLPEELWWVVGCSFHGQPDSPERVRNVMGCNMAFRTAPLCAIGGFNTDLGRVGTYPVGGEETEACLLLGRRDPSARISFVAAAQVNHHVTAGRTRFGYLLQRSYCEGLSKASLSRYAGAGAALATEAGYVRTVLPAAVLRELRHPRRGLPAAAGIVVSVLAAGVGYVRARVVPATPVTATRSVAARATFDQAVSQVAQLKAKIAALDAQEKVGDLAARDQEIAALAAERDAARAQLAETEHRRVDMTPVAPVSGRIEETFYDVGEWVPAGLPVLSLIGDGALKLRFFVPETQVAGVKPGERVAFTCDGCPSGLTATVERVASKAEYTPPVIYSTGARAKLVFLVEARPDTAGAALPPGLPVEVSRDAGRAGAPR